MRIATEIGKTRLHPVFVLLVGCAVASCDETVDPTASGTLVVSTSTAGGDPDQDGYWLTVDGVDSLPLAPSGIAELGLPSGRHALRLHGVAQQCSVVQGPSREVEVPSLGTVAVGFEVTCPASAVRVTSTTSGLDIDPDGYQVVVDGTDRGSIPSNGTLLTRVDPGSRVISLTGLAPQCRTDGPDSRTLTVTDPEVVPVEFAIVCTAATGVIGVVVANSGPPSVGQFVVTIDGAAPRYVGPGGPHYVEDVSGGDHIVSLEGPNHCSVQTDPLPVTITTGTLIRDTVEVSFSVTCEGEPTATVRITAPTTGTIPSATVYSVWHEHFGYWDYGGEVIYLGDLKSGDTLVVDLPVSNAASGGDPYWYRFYLEDAPGTCSVDDPHPYPLPGFAIAYGDTLEVGFVVACPP